jgi:hypothetical protein
MPTGFNANPDDYVAAKKLESEGSGNLVLGLFEASTSCSTKAREQ